MITQQMYVFGFVTFLTAAGWMLRRVSRKQDIFGPFCLTLFSFATLALSQFYSLPTQEDCLRDGGGIVLREKASLDKAFCRTSGGTYSDIRSF